MSLTHDRLTRPLKYNRISGDFVWAQSRGGMAPAGSKAGCLRPNGYVSIIVDGKNYYAHRLAWFYVHGRWPRKHIDHMNGEPSDNRIVNLRECDQSENNVNSKVRSDNKSGLRGVSWNRKDKCWKAFISFRREQRCLGSFKTKTGAHAAYLLAARKIHKLFVREDANKAPETTQ